MRSRSTAGQMVDWDARWDKTGTKLAVWIADSQNPEVGFLSLFARSTRSMAGST